MYIQRILPPSRLPTSNFLKFGQLERQENCFIIHLQSKIQNGVCTECGTKNSRKHSSYVRKLLDLLWAGIPVSLRCVRRRFCLHLFPRKGGKANLGTQHPSKCLASQGKKGIGTQTSRLFYGEYHYSSSRLISATPGDIISAFSKASKSSRNIFA